MMKTLAKITLALAVVAFATPALACGANKVKTAEAKSEQTTVASKQAKPAEAKVDASKAVKTAAN